MADLEKFFQLERLECTGEIETKRRILDEKVRQIERDQASRGFLQSGATIQAITKAHVEYHRDLLQTRISIRRRLAVSEPQLLSDAALDTLQEELERTAQVGVQALQGRFQRQNMAAGRQYAPSRFIQAEASTVAALAKREVNKLRLEREIGMRKHEGSIVLTISNSTINGLNLGSVIGEMNATLTTLERQGNTDLANALKDLSEAIASDELLGTERRVLLEKVSVLSDQAKLPTEQRRIDVVKAAVGYINAAVALGANAATIWAAVGPHITTFFGLPH